MLNEEEAVSLRSAVKLLRMILHRTDLPWATKADADEALRRFMHVVLGTAELPDTAEYRRRPAA